MIIIEHSTTIEKAMKKKHKANKIKRKTNQTIEQKYYWTDSE